MTGTEREPFADRREAGRVLAALVRERVGEAGIVLGLPRGGVPVAAEVAATLGAPLDVLLVRKLGLPGHRELAMGAIAAVGEGIELVRNDRVIARYGVGEAELASALDRERVELVRRGEAYRGDRPPPGVTDRRVVLVDDGLATGATVRAAVAALRRKEPAAVVVAVPVGAADAVAAVAREADDVVCAWVPEPFHAVGQAYRDFGQTTDDEVRRCLALP